MRSRPSAANTPFLSVTWPFRKHANVPICLGHQFNSKIPAGTKVLVKTDDAFLGPKYTVTDSHE